VSGSVTNGDMLDTLLNINEENGEKMDKTTMKHFFLVSIISSWIYFNISHLFTLIFMNML
jgi:hypothetical protein